jgi:hypothetical protein
LSALIGHHFSGAVGIGAGQRDHRAGNTRTALIGHQADDDGGAALLRDGAARRKSQGNGDSHRPKNKRPVTALAGLS